MLPTLLTDIEGAGHSSEGGFVTYTKESKAELLGIEPTVLDQNDAVSEIVARAMAEGAPRRSTADIAVGVTGWRRLRRTRRHWGRMPENNAADAGA